MNSPTNSPSRHQPKHTWFNALISAPPSVHTPDKRREIELLSALSLGFLLLTALGSLYSWIRVGATFTFVAGFAFALVALLTYILSRTPHYVWGEYIFVIGFSLLSYLAAFFDASTSALTLLLTLALTFLLANLLPLRQMIILIVSNLVLQAIFTFAILSQVRGQEAINTVGGIAAIGVFAILFAWHRESLERLRLDEILGAQATLEKTNLALESAQHEAQNRLAELRLATQVGQAISQVNDLNALFSQATERILEQFDLYYVQVYLTDTTNQKLILRYGTGEVGKELLARNHSLSISMASINGRVALEKQPVVIPDTRRASFFLKNPLLPDTRGEMAIPLIIANRVVGTLDMQSNQPNVLTEDTLLAFEALAGQLAVAIQNANLLAEAEQARAEVESLARRQVRKNWGSHLDAIHKPEHIGFSFDRNEISELKGDNPVTPSEKSRVLESPISWIGEKLGSLVVEIDEENKTKEADELVSIVARQVAQQLENLRLLENAERYLHEAEEAARRQTREGWQAYMQARGSKKLGYVYDTTKVVPQDNGDENEYQFTLPLKARDEEVGKLGVEGILADDYESLELATAVAERLSAHIENLRLNEQREEALITTESLYDASREITAAQNVNEVATSLIKYIDRTNLDRVVVALIDKKVKKHLKADVLALWDRAGALQAGNSFTSTQLPILDTLGPQDVLQIDDFSTSKKVDENSRAVFKALGVKSAAIVPISTGETLFGWLLLETTDTFRKFSTEDLSPFSALAGQTAVVFESQQLLIEAQDRARHEQILSEITSAIRSSTAPQTILKTAVRELGAALGRPTMIHLTGIDETEEKIGK